ncbi:hypothetical protein C8F04DRAFT_1268040 [Mycena alexandri]|uniref:Uncharacterized protein n=1 Tax=Mycena alexandri TaxID=1745969 RepID=A0AAD6SFD9_9AGAR|nr:hypothetical protein C8F04DRAFT_1268040 [Mycena alexandri]
MTYHVISVGVRGTGRSSITHGAGPERAIIRHAATVLSQCHHYWQQAPSSEMFRPVFTPGAIPIPERIRTFCAHRMFLALHCLLLQHGPFLISIWLLLCLIRGKEVLLIPQNILLHMDPGPLVPVSPRHSGSAGHRSISSTACVDESEGDEDQ